MNRRHMLLGAASMGLFVGMGRTAHTQAVAESAVEIADGRILGAQSDGIHAFKGIPYGASTGGANRYLPPQPPEPWSGTRDALEFGASAPQLGSRGPGSEDCLFINVYTPGVNDNARRPVMVWLHGGGWRAGSGSQQDGSNLARLGDVVVVTLNHRFTQTGFFWLDDTDERFADSGNAGVLDMIKALEWVRDNVATFGGDPGNVTIFGVSGGASKVACLMSTPRAQGLFHKGIAQSASGNLRNTEPIEARERTHAIAKQLGVERASGEAMQAFSLEQIMGALEATMPTLNAFRPQIDGRTFDGHPWDPDAPALAAGIPLIAGNTLTETTQDFEEIEDFQWSHDEARRRLIRYLPATPDVVDDLMAGYQEVYPDATPSLIVVRLTTDFQYHRNTRRMLELHSANGDPSWAYLLSVRSPEFDGLAGTPHGSCIGFIWGELEGSDRWGDNPGILPLSHQMMRSWTTFARTGDPNNDEIPTWPQFEAVERQTIMFDTPNRVEANPGQAAKDLLNGLPWYEYNMPINFAL